MRSRDVNPSRHWVYWAGLVLAGMLLYGTRWLSLPKHPLNWQLAWAVLVSIPIVATIQFAFRLFAPQKIQVLIDRLTTRQRFALYWLHYLALVGFFVVGIARICVDFDIVPGIHGHGGALQWLWINSIVLIMCLADLSGKTDNIWRPQRPASPDAAPQPPAA
jgi:hypothetical protein